MGSGSGSEIWAVGVPKSDRSPFSVVALPNLRFNFRTKYKMKFSDATDRRNAQNNPKTLVRRAGPSENRKSLKIQSGTVYPL